MPYPQRSPIPPCIQECSPTKGAGSLTNVVRFKCSIGVLPVGIRMTPSTYSELVTFTLQHFECDAARLRMSRECIGYFVQFEGRCQMNVIIQRDNDVALGGLHTVITSHRAFIAG